MCIAAFKLYILLQRRWDKQGGPIFFYAGNEGVIEAFAENRLDIVVP